MTSRDLDGDGPNVPVVTVSGDLLVNTTYAERLVLNESVTPVDDITVEVKEEGAEHQLFFLPEAIEPLLMRMPMVTVNQLIGFYFKNRCSSCSWQYSSHLETRASLKCCVASGSITNAGGAKMHRLPIQFRLNSILVKK
jgi:hypothetical protein